ncbi:hypothetical protein HIM_02596 [Hirsutella minnesotensis 3608]|nr:hypothetical protein HIM_02596 [Hirsutella minnesotensis 3608]
MTHAATQALIRLIELTSQVRTDCQSGFRRKAPGRIHKGIDQFIKWASEDGGYMNLRYVPNITVATVDDSLNETGITLFMEQHMHALARLQREFLKEPPDAAFWDGHDQGAQSKSLSKTPLLQKFLPRGVKSPSSVGRRLAAEDVIKYELVHNESPVKAETIERGQSNFRGLCKTADDELYQDLREETPVSVKGEETVSCTAILATLPCKKENASQERDKGTVLSPIDDEADESERGNPDPKDGDYEPSEGDGESAADDISVECPSTREVTPLPSPVECDAPETPRRVKRESSDNDGLSQWATQYRRRPPVVYGLFVLRTSVFLLTVDSAKGETATVSFHEDMHFADFKRSLWNGLTVAIAVCLARDELMSRRDDFELMVMHDESDPDA